MWDSQKNFLIGFGFGELLELQDLQNNSFFLIGGYERRTAGDALVHFSKHICMFSKCFKLYSIHTRKLLEAHKALCTTTTHFCKHVCMHVLYLFQIVNCFGSTIKLLANVQVKWCHTTTRNGNISN